MSSSKPTLLEWVNAPNSRRLVLEVRAGDPVPSDPYTGEWWSGYHANVDWDSPGVWSWRVWTPLRHATGQARDWGEASTRAEAQRAAARAMLGFLENPTPTERAALARLAGIAAAV